MERETTPKVPGIGGQDNLWDVLSHKVDEDTATERASTYGDPDALGGLQNRSISVK
jgi:hypothetical protein